MIRSEGKIVKKKWILRIYREEKLKVRKSGGSKREIGKREKMLIKKDENVRWLMELV